MPSPLPEYGLGPIPLSTEADPQGRGQCLGELSGRKGSRGLKCPAAPRPGSALGALCGQQACCSARGLSTSSTLCSTVVVPPPTRASPAALMDHLHYLPQHCLNIYQTIMYLVARSGEWKGQKAKLLGPDARVNYRLGKSASHPDLKIK